MQFTLCIQCSKLNQWFRISHVTSDGCAFQHKHFFTFKNKICFSALEFIRKYLYDKDLRSQLNYWKKLYKEKCKLQNPQLQCRHLRSISGVNVLDILGVIINAWLAFLSPPCCHVTCMTFHLGVNMYSFHTSLAFIYITVIIIIMAKIRHEKVKHALCTVSTLPSTPYYIHLPLIYMSIQGYS